MDTDWPAILRDYLRTGRLFSGRRPCRRLTLAGDFLVVRMYY